MRKVHKVLAGGTLAVAVLVSGGSAFADDPTPTTSPLGCTQEQREERWATREQLRTEITNQLQQEGVTDPVQLQEQLRTRLRAEMEARFGDVGEGPGPGPLAGTANGGGGHRSGDQDGTGPGGDRPMDGTGNRWGGNS